MAVNNEENKSKTKKKNITDKTNNTSKKDSKNKMSKKVILEEKDDTFFEDSKENKTVNDTISKKKIIYIIVIIGLLCMIYIMSPKITIKGNKEITINYNQIYYEPGYKGKWLYKDITKNIKVSSNLNNSKVGRYKIVYQFKYGLFNIKKVRIVSVEDNISPEISIDSEVINICPNDEVPKIKYTAIDEYDGDITLKVNENYLEDKIILDVADRANNKTTREITIDRNDKDSPTIELNGKDAIYLNVGKKYNEPGYKAYDNCDGDISDKVAVSGSVGDQIGDYKLIYTVIDNAGNKAEVTRKIIVRNYNLYNSGSITNGAIYLTFDDGPNEGTTNVILDILKEEGIKATFFVTCKGQDYLIKRIYDEGHTVALHTCTHEYSEVYSSVDNYFNDLNRVSNRVKNITGLDVKIIRFPGGSSNTISRNYSYGIMSTLSSMVLDKGYRYFDWNVDSNDAGGANTSSQVYNNVVNHLSHSRANVVLMHDIKPQTRDALKDIIEYAKKEEYVFGKLENDTYMIRHSINN